MTNNQQAARDWLPIESAPRDSSRVIVACWRKHTGEWRVCEAWWAMPYEGAADRACYWRYDGDRAMLDTSIHGIGATHWQPLPAPPRPTQERSYEG